MTLLEGLIAALVAALVAAAGFFRAWRRQAGKTKDAERRVDQAEGRAGHQSAVRDAGDAAKREGEKAVEDARRSAREGRRDHFEGQ